MHPKKEHVFPLISLCSLYIHQIMSHSHIGNMYISCMWRSENFIPHQSYQPNNRINRINWTNLYHHKSFNPLIYQCFSPCLQPRHAWPHPPLAWTRPRRSRRRSLVLPRNEEALLQNEWYRFCKKRGKKTLYNIHISSWIKYTVSTIIIYLWFDITS